MKTKAIITDLSFQNVLRSRYDIGLKYYKYTIVGPWRILHLKTTKGKLIRRTCLIIYEQPIWVQHLRSSSSAKNTFLKIFGQ